MLRIQLKTVKSERYTVLIESSDFSNKPTVALDTIVIILK